MITECGTQSHHRDAFFYISCSTCIKFTEVSLNCNIRRMQKRGHVTNDHKHNYNLIMNGIHSVIYVYHTTIEWLRAQQMSTIT